MRTATNMLIPIVIFNPNETCVSWLTLTTRAVNIKAPTTGNRLEGTWYDDRDDRELGFI
jgi:hypothetical protein